MAQAKMKAKAPSEMPQPQGERIVLRDTALVAVRQQLVDAEKEVAAAAEASRAAQQRLRDAEKHRGVLLAYHNREIEWLRKEQGLIEKDNIGIEADGNSLVVVITKVPRPGPGNEG